MDFSPFYKGSKWQNEPFSQKTARNDKRKRLKNKALKNFTKAQCPKKYLLQAKRWEKTAMKSEKFTMKWVKKPFKFNAKACKKCEQRERKKERKRSPQAQTAPFSFRLLCLLRPQTPTTLNLQHCITEFIVRCFARKYLPHWICRAAVLDKP